MSYVYITAKEDYKSDKKERQEIINKILKEIIIKELKTEQIDCK